MLKQPRSTQRQKARKDVHSERLKMRITELACAYGRYGYRRITAMLREEG